jgi:hypothetical protein
MKDEEDEEREERLTFMLAIASALLGRVSHSFFKSRYTCRNHNILNQ